MSWKRIKTFLIILFLIINIYLVLSTDVLIFKSTTNFDSKSISKTTEIIKNNFNIEIDKNHIWSKIQNLNIIEVDNIIFSDNISNKTIYQITDSGFGLSVNTGTSSYNESNARLEIVPILESMGINSDSYNMEFKYSDSGLLCLVQEHISGYPLFNGQIKALFSSQAINITGNWYFPKTTKVEAVDNSLKMADISAVLIDMASEASSDSASNTSSVESVDYGYYVSSHDENVISKTASAVPCYKIVTDIGSIYYYDATNGNLLKKEG